MSKVIGIIVGSLRRDSINKKMAHALSKLAPSTLSFKFINIGNLPLYNEDVDGNPPAEWVTFRDEVKSCDGYLFVTPEYNRSIPGVLKNAIDVGSRPYGGSSWEGKPAAVVSVSPGALGGFGSNHHLRQTFVFLNIPCMPQPEAYIGQGNSLFDEEGNFKDPDKKTYFQKFMTAFDQWVHRQTS